MGLDMYMYVDKPVDDFQDEGSSRINTILETSRFPRVLCDVTSIAVRVYIGYWRKDYPIHGWMVENVQSGEDNCQEYHVSVDKLRDLLAICKDVKATRDIALLHSCRYRCASEDDDYFSDAMSKTILTLESAISLASQHYSVYYRASW